jgi:cysteinyl-tRNA synthetase
MWFLQGHYSQPIEYSEQILREKGRAYERLRNVYTQIGDSTSSSELSDSLATELEERFDAAMCDDFDTPRALAVLFEAAGRVGQGVSAGSAAAKEFLSFRDTLAEHLFTLGFTLPVWSEIKLTWHVDGTPPIVKVRDDLELEEQIMEKIARREQARREKNWVVADQLRDKLHNEGWSVEDTPDGPIVSRR